MQLQENKVFYHEANKVCVSQDGTECVGSGGGGERPGVIGRGGSRDQDQQY